MKVRIPWHRLVTLGVFATWLAVAWWHTHKPLPPGTHVSSPVCMLPIAAPLFIADTTTADAFGRPLVSQGIFDAVLAVIAHAQRFIVLDYTVVGGAADVAAPQRRVAGALTEALLARTREQPDIAILFVTDPASESYGAVPSDPLQLLRAAGVEVVTTDLNRLRDSNFAYSSLWRLALRWWDSPSGPFGIGTRQLNFKANDRKLIIADEPGGDLTAIVGSANPSDAESAWSNVAVRVQGPALRALLESELEIARFSGWRGRSEAYGGGARAATPPECPAAGAAALPAPPAIPEGSAAVQLLTEGAIRTALLARLDATTAGDSIDAALEYLADRGVVESLLAAARRHVSVRLILDPNEGAMRGGAAGIPNQPVASELVSRSDGSIRVRWYRTHGERFHPALLLVYGAQRLWLSAGSAQLTRRNLEDYNLEANAAIELARAAPLAQQALQYFDTLWANRAAPGIEYTADFAVFANPAQVDYWLYRLMEGSGLSAF
jgi:phosphatidylserine/phosphatidylglycerophosphate/cardiolipin synthase-like enzyme